MRQLADDPARTVAAEGVWMGDPKSFRMPVDWRFTLWKVAALAAVPLFLLTWLVVPTGLYALLAAVLASGWAARRLGLSRARRWALAGAVVSAAALAVPPGVLLLPAPWWVALPVAPVLALVLAHRYAAHVDTNRPLAYWQQTLHALAAGPRPRARTELAAGEGPAGGDGADVHPILYATLDLPEDTMSLRPYHPAAAVVQADRWLPHDRDRAAKTLYSLARAQVTCMVRDDGVLVADGVAIRSGMWVVVTGRGVLEVGDKDFRAGYTSAEPTDAPG